jgi:hypothetical protein
MTDDQNISLSVPQRSQWNDYISHVSSMGGDPTDVRYMTGFKKDNPDTTLTSDHIPTAINEVNQLKQGNPIGSMTQTQAQTIKSGMSDSYASNSSNLKYPVSPAYGTDLEKHADEGGGAGRIPTPDYDDPQSRLNYAQAFTNKYGPLMHDRGDTPLRINEAPELGSDSAKVLATKAASKYGLDPALLYSSAMEEGMSGLYPDKKGNVDFSGDDKHPISGMRNFGLDRFGENFNDLVKGGYLTKDFANKFKPSPEVNEKGEHVLSANFTDTDSAVQASAAVVKYTQDHLENFANKNNIALTPRAKEFFSLVGYNAGEDDMRKMLSSYSKSGYLKDDSFIDKRPSSSWAVPWENVSRRVKMRDALKSEGLF